LEAKITWPLKRFCHQNQSQNYGGIWGPHKLYETMHNKQAWYFVGQNYYFSGNPQKPSKGVPSWFPIVLTYNGEVMNIEKKKKFIEKLFKIKTTK
jgi:hypothetical protein